MQGGGAPGGETPLDFVPKNGQTCYRETALDFVQKYCKTCYLATSLDFVPNILPKLLPCYGTRFCPKKYCQSCYRAKQSTAFSGIASPGMMTRPKTKCLLKMFQKMRKFKIIIKGFKWHTSTSINDMVFVLGWFMCAIET